MTIDFYNCIDANNKLVKTLDNQTKLTVTGNVKGVVNLITPLITVTANILNKNYCYISEFNRYYFVDDIQITRTGLYEIRLKLDALMTYHSSISSCKIISNQSNKSKYLSGYSQTVDSRYNYNYYDFDNNFNEDGSIILVAINGVRGGGS